MAKRILVLLLLLFVGFKFALPLQAAAGDTPGNARDTFSEDVPFIEFFGAFNKNIPGVSCGDATNPTAMRCCEENKKIAEIRDYFDGLRVKLEKLDKDTIATKEWTEEQLKLIEFLEKRRTDFGVIIEWFNNGMITKKMIVDYTGPIPEGTEDFYIRLVEFSDKLGNILRKVTGGEAIGNAKDVRTFKEFLGNYMSFAQSEALIKSEFDEQFPSFGCLLGLCISDIPKALAESFIKRVGIVDLYTESQASFTPCLVGKPDKDAVVNGTKMCICQPVTNTASVACNKYIRNDKASFDKCMDCTEERKGIWTGIGCINPEFGGFVTDNLLPLGIRFAGLASLLCIIYSAFILQTSRGNPERIKKAREYLTNCIIGLILIIFSIFILRLIGVNILRIPGFS